MEPVGTPSHPAAAGKPDASARSAKVRQVLQELWEANRGTIAERISSVRLAHEHLLAGNLDTGARDKAISAAHKLAGVLGTFGFPRGSELALQAQVLLEQTPPLPTQEIERLKGLIDELSVIVTTQSLPSPES